MVSVCHAEDCKSASTAAESFEVPTLHKMAMSDYCARYQRIGCSYMSARSYLIEDGIEVSEEMPVAEPAPDVCYRILITGSSLAFA